MGNLGTGIIAIASAAIGLAIIAVLVSQRANTPQVISSLSTGFGSIINAAVSPVSGGANGTGIGTGIGGMGAFGGF